MEEFVLRTYCTVTTSSRFVIFGRKGFGGATMANDTATDVPGWVSLCGSVAPFAALVVILAVSFSKQGCDRKALSIQLSTDSDALQPLLILALSNYPKNTERAKCQISPSSTL